MSNIELYSEYRIVGRGTAFAVLIPVEIGDDEVTVIHKSVGATRKKKDKEEMREKISNNLYEEEVRKSYVKQEEVNPEVIDRMDECLKDNSGRLDGDEWKAALEEVRAEVNNQN